MFYQSFVIIAVALLVAKLTIISPSLDNGATYKIKKIKQINSWYVIYAKKEQAWYKIITKADAKSDLHCTKIKSGKSFDLELIPMRNNAPVINGIKLDPVGYTGCFQFDEETNICLELNKGIDKLYFSNDLKGLCYR